MLYEQIIEKAKGNLIIFDSFVKAKQVYDSYNNIICSISGGSDSDIILDICAKLDTENKVKYIFINTGLEYEATKAHIQYLRDRYKIDIQEVKAIKSIPLCCRQYGQPFISKIVSQFIGMLQGYNFSWEDLSYDEMIESGISSSMAKWWNNSYDFQSYNVNRYKYLKDFLIEYPPTFKISSKCCNYAKKASSRKVEKEYKAELKIVGLRRVEGGHGSRQALA